MNALEFEQLCRDTSLLLGVEDIGALGQGFSMQYASVPFEAAFTEGRESFLLTAELGVVTGPCRVSAYENLLTIQLMTWNQAGIRFGFNPDRQTVVLCAKTKLGPHATPAWLATVVRSIAMQVVEWRKTLLEGYSIPPDQENGVNEPSLADYLAQRI